MVIIRKDDKLSWDPLRCICHSSSLFPCFVFEPHFRVNETGVVGGINRQSINGGRDLIPLKCAVAPYYLLLTISECSFVQVLYECRLASL